MAKRGRKAKSDTIKILEGTREDRVGLLVPTSPQRLPGCPAHLEDDEREKWSEVVHELSQAGILDQTDADLLALYCVVFVRWVAARKEIGTDLLVSTGLGGVKANPAVAIAAQSETQLRSLQDQLGLTPESRARLQKLNLKPAGDELDDFLDKKAN